LDRDFRRPKDWLSKERARKSVSVLSPQYLRSMAQGWGNGERGRDLVGKIDPKKMQNRKAV
jgi:hypothetical protein